MTEKQTKEYEKFLNYYSLKDSIIEKLLRSNVFLPFGLEALKYPIIFTENLPAKAPACTDFNNIYINPNDSFFIDSGDKILYVLTFVILHEIGHNIFMHKIRGERKDPTAWQYSIDYFLNLFLRNIELENRHWEEQSNLILMNIDQYSDQILFDEKFNNMIEEEIYEKLLKNNNFKKEESQQSYKDFLDEVGLPSDGVPNDSKIKVTKTQLEIDGKTEKKTFVEFPKPEETKEVQKAEEQFDDQLAKTMFETRILSKGFQSSTFENFLKRIFKTKVSWDVILRDSILIELQKKGDISYSKPRMIWLSQPTLPYLPNVQEEETYGTLVLLIDESGSMTDEDIAKAIDIAQQADSYYKNVLVIKHDTIVKWSKLYEDKLIQKDIDELCIRRHQGGTSHSDAFQKVLEFEKNNNTFISLVLSLTDLCSNIPQAQKILPSRIPRIYLRTNKDYTINDVIGKIIDLS